MASIVKGNLTICANTGVGHRDDISRFNSAYATGTELSRHVRLWPKADCHLAGFLAD